MASETLVRADGIAGEWVRPKNRWQNVGPTSIHNDAVAKKVGMRGGTIPGTVHLSHFAPLLTQLFGDRWLSQGTISMFYTFATLDGEEVRAVAKAPETDAADVQLEAWVETPEGKTVCKGAVSVGRPDAVPYVRGLPLENAPADEIRILKAMTVGQEIGAKDDYVIPGDVGVDGIVSDPQQMHRALSVYTTGVELGPAVGFYGATEIALRAGPIRTGVPYRKTGRVVCVGASPKTEFAWFDSEFRDQDGRLIAEMRHMTRWMKASHPAWA
ncbi:hypothetical protein [Phenylobacterium sp.]|jgi:hypothetical protein|uniref:hypothetical protein n=1 Tax=Phenylobacterium sp. TaxID=1871053 RepID=UPI002F94D827